MTTQASEQGQDPRKVQIKHLEQESEQVQAHGQDQAQGNAEQPEDLSQGLDQTLSLLKVLDDTYRFVGLALLKSILDNNVELLKDPEVIRRCWAAIPTRFLDRLLRAPSNEDRDKKESLSMVQLAVAVLHTFIVRFSEDLSDDEKAVGKIEGLLDIVAWSPSDTRTQILQILLTLASKQTGSTVILCSERWAHLVDFAPQDDLALDVIKFAFLNTPSEVLQKPDILRKVNETLSHMVSPYRSTAMHPQLFQALHEIFSLLPLSVRSYSTVFELLQVLTVEQVFPPSPLWLSSIAALIHQNIIELPKWNLIRDRKPTVLLTATLLHVFHTEFANLLFNGPSTPSISQDSKPVSYLFVTLLLIDLREAVPTLRKGFSSNYFHSLDAIAASYDIISTFIGFLVHFLDEEDPPPENPDNEIKQPSASPFPPFLLLQLRVDMSETMSLTIENLRERLENSYYDAKNLLPITPSHSKMASSTPRQQETLTISQVRTLALWLREDDNEALRKEAASISNILLDLYGAESDQFLEFRSPVLIALEGIIKVPEGVEAFLAAGGWITLSGDLRAILTSTPSTDDRRASFTRGIEIVRILLDVVESDFVGPAKEDWMSIVGIASVSSPSSFAVVDQTSFHIRRIDLQIATAQLAVELLVRAPRNVRRRAMPAARKLLHKAREIFLQGVNESEEDDVGFVGISRDAMDGAEEVMRALQGLGVRCIKDEA
ncbi:hypothetical protein MMC22_005039 [Lobaria immixta]|nr:hypothetical protein [Lobaria immixta]